VDTAISAQILYPAPMEWTSSLRSWEDFYDESMLVWLEADTIIREKSGGNRSLDDFCRIFFGGADGLPDLRPYTREDVETALGKVTPFDWHGFFQTRLYDVRPQAPLGGLAGSGWKLVYDDRPNEFHLVHAAYNKVLDHTFDIGLLVDPAGLVKDVVLDSAAWRGGLGPGMRVVAVNGRKFAPEVLEEELKAARKSPGAIAFTLEHGEALKILRVDYHDGVLYPHLERDPSRLDLLAAILTPRGRP
jgi:predicted metalloprotease with PDZ domain